MFGPLTFHLICASWRFLAPVGDNFDLLDLLGGERWWSLPSVSVASVASSFILLQSFCTADIEARVRTSGGTSLSVAFRAACANRLVCVRKALAFVLHGLALSFTRVGGTTIAEIVDDAVGSSGSHVLFTGIIVRDTLTVR